MPLLRLYNLPTLQDAMGLSADFSLKSILNESLLAGSTGSRQPLMNVLSSKAYIFATANSLKISLSFVSTALRSSSSSKGKSPL